VQLLIIGQCHIKDYARSKKILSLFEDVTSSYLCLRMLPVLFILCDNLAVFYAVKMSTQKYLIERSTHFAHHICINLSSQWHKRYHNSQYGLL